MTIDEATRHSPANATGMSLSGRVAVVTGASSGIGAAAATRLAGAGASVLLLSRRVERIEATAAGLRAAGRTALAAQGDVTDPVSLASAARLAAERLGRVDLLVNNAGVMYPRPFEEGRTDEWRAMVDTNVLGVLYATRAFLPALLEAARDGAPTDLVNVSSIAGTRMFPPGYAVYNASKAATNALSESLRAEFGPLGVRVTDVQPGLVATEVGEHTTHQPSRDQIDTLFREHHALTPDELADVLVFVVSRPPHLNVPQLVASPITQ